MQAVIGQVIVCTASSEDVLINWLAMHLSQNVCPHGSMRGRPSVPAFFFPVKNMNYANFYIHSLKSNLQCLKQLAIVLLMTIRHMEVIMLLVSKASRTLIYPRLDKQIDLANEFKIG